MLDDDHRGVMKFLAGAVILLSGCSSEHAMASTVVRRDSAGIWIVETTISGSPAVKWALDPTPEVSIGQVQGDEPYLFSQVKGALRLDDGGIVVADGQSAQLRFFDSRGVFRRASGGLGGGPEEFSHLEDVQRCGDRLYALNLSPSRVSVWSTEGRWLRDFALFEPGTKRGPYMTGRLTCSPDGELVVMGWGESMSGRYRGQSTAFEDYAPLWVLDTIGQVVSELGIFPTTQRVSLLSASGGGTITTPPLGRNTVLAFGTDRVLIGTAEDFEIQEYSRVGHLRRRMRVSGVDLTPHDALEAISADSTGRDARLLSRIKAAGLPLPSRLPAYRALLLDEAGFLWVERYPHSAHATITWGIFSPDGSFLGELTMPNGLSLLDIGMTYVLGLQRDEMDVERVTLYRLDRTPRM